MQLNENKNWLDSSKENNFVSLFMRSDQKRDENLKEGLTAVIVTNDKITNIKSLEEIMKITDDVVIVTNRQEDSLTRDNLRIIYSNSQNFSYLRNLGAYYAKTTHILSIDSDELVDNILIQELKKIDFKKKLYCVRVNMYIGDYKMSMSSTYVQRIYHKGYFFYIKRVHEVLYPRKKECKKLNGNTSNFSQKDWNEWFIKAKKYASEEHIDFILIFRTFHPFILFFSHQGWRDGLFGVKWTLRSFQYRLMIYLYGKKGYITLKPNEIRYHISENTLSKDEREYIEFILKQYFGNSSLSIPKNKHPFVNDVLEQISSPFIRYY